MSRANVETVRRAIEGFNRGELHLETLHSEIEWHTTPNLPEAATHRGHAAVESYLSGFSEAFDDFSVTEEELRDVDEYVIASMLFRARIKGSEDAVELRETHVWRFRDGRAFEVREYSLHDEAVEAVAARARPERTQQVDR